LSDPLSDAKKDPRDKAGAKARSEESVAQTCW